MSRQTQIIGLTLEARKFLKAGAFVKSRKPYEDAAELGMYDDGPKLYAYTKNHKTTVEKVKEVVQCVQWSSGPCIFICLETDKGVTSSHE